MNNEAIERLTAQLNQLQVSVNRIQRELAEARQQNIETNNNRNRRNTHASRRHQLSRGDRVVILNKLRLLGIAYPKRTVFGEVVGFTNQYVLVNVKIPGTVDEYHEVKRAPHNLEKVQSVQQ